MKTCEFLEVLRSFEKTTKNFAEEQKAVKWRFKEQVREKEEEIEKLSKKLEKAKIALESVAEKRQEAPLSLSSKRKAIAEKALSDIFGVE